MEYRSNSPKSTQSLARLLAQEILKHKPKTRGTLVIALKGELGSGKTTFIQGFAKGLGIQQKITSPTFLIIRSYKISKFKLLNSKFQNFYHIDAYRIKKPKELLALGFKEIITDPTNIVIIEWADKIKRLIPKKSLWIELEHGKRERERIVKMKIVN